MQDANESLGKVLEPAQVESDARAPMTWRILLIGVVLIPLMCIVVEYGEIVRMVDLVSTSLMLIVTTILVLFIALNAALKRWAPRWSFTRAELLFLFVMLTVAGNVAGTGMMQMVPTMLTTLQHFTTPENRWAQFQPLVRDWMIPDEGVIEAFWRGQSTFYTLEHIKGWMGTILIWSFFAFAYICCTLCFNVLVRRQWVDRERLPFPIVYFPLELTREGKQSLLRHKLLWIGFAIAVVLETLAGLHYIFPSLPYLPLKAYEPSLNIGRFFGAVPSEESVNLITLSFYPWAIGIAYFVQREVLFASWFFYWLSQMEEYACILLGYRGPGAGSVMNQMPYLYQQSAGAFLGLGLVILWASRRHLLAVTMAAIRGGRESDSRDFISYRAALIGFLASGGCVFGFWYMTGVALHILILFSIIFFLMVLGYTRIRAEAGLPWGFGPSHPPHYFFTRSYGALNMSAQTIGALNFNTWLAWDWRGTTMPHQMEGLKIASSANLKGRDMVKGIVLASGIAIVAAFIALLALYYRYGAESGNLVAWRPLWAVETWDMARDYVESGANTDWTEIGGGAAGVTMIFWLAWMQKRFLWWPFHPIGYVVGTGFGATTLWCPLLVAWAIKTVILRYGGMRMYLRGIPFAVGLILGDFFMAAVWGVAGMAAGRSLYITFP